MIHLIGITPSIGICQTTGSSSWNRRWNGMFQGHDDCLWNEMNERMERWKQILLMDWDNETNRLKTEFTGWSLCCTREGVLGLPQKVQTEEAGEVMLEATLTGLLLYCNTQQLTCFAWHTQRKNGAHCLLVQKKMDARSPSSLFDPFCPFKCPACDSYMPITL